MQFEHKFLNVLIESDKVATELNKASEEGFFLVSANLKDNTQAESNGLVQLVAFFKKPIGEKE
jgi:hypothetical protein